MSKHIVSIIIPLYNNSKQLVACLNSIKKQTFQDFEIIIVNDGSTDITHEQLIEMVNGQMSHVKCLYQPNQGAPIARNNGFKQSTGQYVLFCDADLVMKPDMLEKMVKVLDANPNISYVYSSFKFGWKKFRLWEFNAEKLKQMPYIHTTSLIRRECLSGFSAQGGPWDPNLKRLQDWDLWLTMLERDHVGKWIPEVLFMVKAGGTMSSWLPSFFTKIPFGVKQKAYQQVIFEVKQKHRF